MIATYPIKKGWQNGIGRSGYGYIKKALPAFNAAAATVPFIVLADADDRPCPPETIRSWLGSARQHPNLFVRIAVREVESWLLADRVGISNFLAVNATMIPNNPTNVLDPKLAIVELAKQSSRSAIREELAPSPGTRGQVGPYYTQGLSGFARDLWDIDAAAIVSESLMRATWALARLR